METHSRIAAFLAFISVAFAAIPTLADKILIAFSAVRKSILTGFAAVMMTILLISIAPISHAKRLSSPTLACNSIANWVQLGKAFKAGSTAFKLKAQIFIAEGKCESAVAGLPCKIIELGARPRDALSPRIDEVYIADFGPFYIQNAIANGCSE